MRLNEISFDMGKPVDGYGPGFFRIGGEKVEGAVAVFPDGVHPWGGLDDHATLLDRAGQVDVIFVGMGAAIAHPPAELRAALEAAGLGFEVMASDAACRTYNVLLAEGRRVGLALLPV